MQSYSDHVRHVVTQGAGNAAEAGVHSHRFGGLLRLAVRLAAEYHDLGKLDEANQRVLASAERGRLPLNHVDGGVAHLLQGAATDMSRQLAALTVYAHHQGLPDIEEEAQKGEDCFRDCAKQTNGRRFRQLIDERLARYLQTHRAVVGLPVAPFDSEADGLPTQLTRIALSCLVDADHGDTARHYGGPALPKSPSLLPDQRLAKLNEYVAGLPVGPSQEKARLRAAVYAACRDAPTEAAMVECDSPVGSGKTTAVMAHLLQAAKDKRLRRIIVVLPFTNIIDQSVDVYRRSLLLPGEGAEEVVAAHHHRAEYGKPDSRHLAALWEAPIVVTTAVQFFETLAARSPASLRKLHQVPGSGLFIDESHASLPAALWPQAWDWLTRLARDWGCHVVLGSGSLNRLWQLPEFAVQRQPADLPALVHAEARKLAAEAETYRISYQTRPQPLTLEELADWLPDLDGPRLVIVNTVQIAAGLAKVIAGKQGRSRVEHLSTALTPSDRAQELSLVKLRLNSSNRNSDWTLVATSCVEAGVDVSFRTGFRQRASLSSLIQLGGRVNRSGESPSADVWDFQLVPGGLVNTNPGYKDSAEVLGQLLKEGKVSPEFCTEALRREIRRTGRADLNEKLRKAEANLDFPEVEELFRVIDQDTETVVVDKELEDQLDRGLAVDWRQLQQRSVQIYSSNARKWGITEFASFPGLMRWTLDYDAFLGYMAGALPLVEGNETGFVV